MLRGLFVRFALAPGVARAGEPKQDDAAQGAAKDIHHVEGEHGRHAMTDLHGTSCNWGFTPCWSAAVVRRPARGNAARDRPAPGAVNRLAAELPTAAPGVR